MTGTPDKPKRRWPPDLSDLRLICSTCPNAKPLTFDEAAKAFGITVSALGLRLEEHCRDSDRARAIAAERAELAAEDAHHGLTGE